jgi:hypothetical protein
MEPTTRKLRRYRTLRDKLASAVAYHTERTDERRRQLACVRRLLNGLVATLDHDDRNDCEAFVAQLDADARAVDDRVYVDFTETDDASTAAWRTWLLVNGNEDSLARLGAATASTNRFELRLDNIEPLAAIEVLRRCGAADAVVDGRMRSLASDEVLSPVETLLRHGHVGELFTTDDNDVSS